jgi:CHAT domain-containing protein
MNTMVTLAVSGAAEPWPISVSLWPVEDEATGRLMARFYESLGKDGVRGAVLRQNPIRLVSS